MYVQVHMHEGIKSMTHAGAVSNRHRFLERKPRGKQRATVKGRRRPPSRPESGLRRPAAVAAKCEMVTSEFDSLECPNIVLRLERHEEQQGEEGDGYADFAMSL